MSSSSPAPAYEQSVARQRVMDWIKGFVIELDLCPFAHRPLDAGLVRTVLAAGDVEAVLTCLAHELERLAGQDEHAVRAGATTVIAICQPDASPGIAADFDDYLDLFAMAEDLLIALGYEGRIQLASFHPDYCFEGEPPEDPAHWSNRSPVPLIHLLLEGAVTAAVAGHPDPDGIPERNIEMLRGLGIEGIRRLQKSQD